MATTTLDEVHETAPHRPSLEEADAERERWGHLKKMAFAALKPAALSLVAPDGPVTVGLWDGAGEVRWIGHNRGVWPAKLAKSGPNFKDTVSCVYDKGPFCFIGTQFRVWCVTAAARDRLAESVADLIRARAEEAGGLEALRHDFQDLGPDLNLSLFEVEVHGIAERLGIPAWDDDGLSIYLDRVVERAGEIAKKHGARVTADLFERLMFG